MSVVCCWQAVTDGSLEAPACTIAAARRGSRSIGRVALRITSTTASAVEPLVARRWAIRRSRSEDQSTMAAASRWSLEVK